MNLAAYKIKVCLDGKKILSLDIPTFAKIFELSYLPHLIYANSEIEAHIQKKCTKADRRGKIEPLARWLGIYHGKQLDEEIVPQVTLKWIDSRIGYGIFADKLFKKWQFIGEYSGVLRRRNRFFLNVNDYCFMYPRPFKLQWKAFTIDSEKKGNLTRFINHSDKPNAESICVFYKGLYRVVIRTLKEIYPGEEITYDYGQYYWQKRTKISDPSSPEGSWLTSKKEN